MPRKQTSARLFVPQPYVAVVDPQGGKGRAWYRRRTQASAAGAAKKRPAEGAADRSLQGLLTESVGSAVVIPPAIRRDGWPSGSDLSGLAGRTPQPYYRQLRQTAFANWQQGWPTRANEALGGSDQLTPDGLHSIAFGLIESMMSPDMKQGFPAFVNGMLAARKSSTTCCRGSICVTREEFINYSGEWVTQPVWTTSMTGGEPVARESGSNPANPTSCRRDQVRGMSSFRASRFSRPPERTSCSRSSASSRVRSWPSIASARADGHPARRPTRVHGGQRDAPLGPRRIWRIPGACSTAFSPFYCACPRARCIPPDPRRLFVKCPLSVVSGPLHRNADDRALCRALKLTGRAPGWRSERLVRSPRESDDLLTNMPRIVVVGSSNTDMTVRLPRLPAAGQTVLGSGFATTPGGKGANQAVAACRAGGRSSLSRR